MRVKKRTSEAKDMFLHDRRTAAARGLSAAETIFSNGRSNKRMNISARNALKGTIKRLTPGAVNTEVIIDIANGIEVVSIITKESAERLSLAVGKEVYAVVKASDVMIATD